MSVDPCEIYRIASTRVPAYQRFLAERCGGIPVVESLADFQALPMMKKADYIATHPLLDLCLDGTLLGKHFLVKSSGTSGKAFFWPILMEEDEGVVGGMTRFMSRILREEMLPTLVVIAFPLGAWSTGVTSCCSFKNLAATYRGLSVVTPGHETDEILEVLAHLSPLYKQTILLTFPPHAKAVLEEGIARGLPMASYNLMLVVGGEGISEGFREHLIRLVRPEGAFDPTAVWSVYGSADFGDAGYESHPCLTLRRLLHEKGLGKEILGTDEIPMIFQWSGEGAYFEIIEGELVVSRMQAVPIVRYRTGDHVEIVPYDEMERRVAAAGFDLETWLGFPPLHPQFRGPFLLLYGRVDGAIFFYGAYITVDQVRLALESPSLSRWYNDKFLMRTISYDNGDAEMEITLEDSPALREANLDSVGAEVAAALSRTHDQYREFSVRLGTTAHPRIVLAPAEAFRTGWKYRRMLKT